MAWRDWLIRAPNRNSNGQARKRDQTASFSRNPRASSSFFMSRIRYDQFSTKSSKSYTVVTDIQCRSQIWPQNCPELNIHKDPIKNSYDMQTLIQDFLMNNGQKHTIQAPVYSMFKDLLNPHVDFKNWRFRKFTSWWLQCEIRECLAPIQWNRWPTIVRKVIGRFSTTQKRTIMTNFPAAIDEQALQQLVFGTILPQITMNRTHKRPADEESTKH